MKTLDLSVLELLYLTNSKSGQEDEIRDLIIGFVSQIAPKAKVDVDQKGNVMVVKGKAKSYPCVIAHMDEVHSQTSDLRIVRSGDAIFGWSDKAKGTAGIGADDKNGIFVCLNVLNTLDAVKVVFTVGEEIGGTGARAIKVSKWLSDVRYVIQADRRNGSDFITTINGDSVASSEFMKAAREIVTEYGYKKESGNFTDVLVLKQEGLNVSVCNMSCGYYHPHTAQECTYISELNNCIEAVIALCTRLTDTFNHKMPKQPKYKPYQGMGFGSGAYNRDYSPVHVIDRRVNPPDEQGKFRFGGAYDCRECVSMNCWGCPKYKDRLFEYGSDIY
jgi:putative aminopeptidase FrvX